MFIIVGKSEGWSCPSTPLMFECHGRLSKHYKVKVCSFPKSIFVKKGPYPNLIVHSPKCPRHSNIKGVDGRGQPSDLPIIEHGGIPLLLMHDRWFFSIKPTFYPVHSFHCLSKCRWGTWFIYWKETWKSLFI